MPVDPSVKRLNCTIGCPVASGRTSECDGTVPGTPFMTAMLTPARRGVQDAAGAPGAGGASG
jgi:hypothetical protein